MTESNNRILEELTEEMLANYGEKGEKLAGKTGCNFNEAVLFLYWNNEFLDEIGSNDYDWDKWDPASVEPPEDAPTYEISELVKYINSRSGLDKDTIKRLYEADW